MHHLKKIDRSAFLYLDPKGVKHLFAQCATCMMATSDYRKGATVGRCTILGKDFEIHLKEGTCCFYVHGDPHTEMRGKEKPHVTPKEAGYEKRKVRCENCKFYKAELIKLNQELQRVRFYVKHGR